MSSAGNGTIRGREVKEVIRDLMRQRKVPAHVWNLTPRGILTILVGTRIVEIPCPAGQTFYGLQAALRRIEQALDERERGHDRRQIDLEDLIKEARV